MQNAYVTQDRCLVSPRLSVGSKSVSLFIKLGKVSLEDKYGDWKVGLKRELMKRWNSKNQVGGCTNRGILRRNSRKGGDATRLLISIGKKYAETNCIDVLGHIQQVSPLRVVRDVTRS